MLFRLLVFLLNDPPTTLPSTTDIGRVYEKFETSKTYSGNSSGLPDVVTVRHPRRGKSFLISIFPSYSPNLNSVKGKDNFRDSVAVNRNIQAAAGLKLQLEFAELVGGSLRQRQGSFL